MSHQYNGTSKFTKVILGLKSKWPKSHVFLVLLDPHTALDWYCHFGAFNYNDSETNISIYIVDLWLWFKVCWTFLLGCPQAPQIQWVQTRINDIFPLQIWLLSCSCLCKHSHPPRLKARSLGTLLTPPFSSPSQRFLLLCPVLFCHLNSKCTSKYPNTAYKAVHNLAVAYLDCSIFCLPFLLNFCASHFKPWRPFPYSFVSGSSYKLTKLPASLFPHFLFAQWTPVHSVRPN